MDTCPFVKSACLSTSLILPTSEPHPVIGLDVVYGLLLGRQGLAELNDLNPFYAFI